MPPVLHKFRNLVINPDVEILILGTFNPGVDIPNGPNFFYGRPRNFLWQLLPGCWDEPSLKKRDLEAKKSFMAMHKIDFVDLILEVDVPEDQQKNYLDTFLDGRVTLWKDVIALIKQLPKLKAIYFTRKTFGGVGKILHQIHSIQNHCQQNGIRFCLLNTPARNPSLAKQKQWIDTIVNQTTSLQPPM